MNMIHQCTLTYMQVNEHGTLAGLMYMRVNEYGTTVHIEIHES